MNTKFGVKNFRIFNNNGVDIGLAPITLLTGCNSAGKSSFVKALMLLSKCLQRIDADINLTEDFKLDDCYIDFTEHQNLSMGRFDKVLNNSNKENNEITFSYTILSNFLAEEISVELSFVAHKKDELNRGWLSSIVFKNSHGDIILSAIIDDEKNTKFNINLAILKDNFFNWLKYTIGVQLQNELHDIDYFGWDGINNNFTREERDSAFQEIKASVKNITPNSKICYLKNQDIKLPEPLDIWKSLKISSEYGSILYMPILNSLKGLSKNGSIEFLSQIKINDSILQQFTDRVIGDFRDSKFESFIEYYLDKENNALIFSKSIKGAFDIFNLSFNGGFFFKQLAAITPIEACEVGPYTPAIGCFGDKIITDKEELDKSNEEELQKLLKEFSFYTFYETLLRINSIKYPNWEEDYITKINDPAIYNERHLQQAMICIYLKYILSEVIAPNILSNTQYVGSNRINVQRLYSFDEGNTDFNKLLKRYFNAKRVYKGDYVPDTFTNNWLKKFEIGESLDIKLTQEGLGITIYLNKLNGDRHLLADEGYGISQLISIILEIETSILEAIKITSRNNKGEKVDVYQAITIAIEEPEIHLHPKYQSMLAEMFMEAYKEFNIHFIVETHSEYLIRKSQVLVAKEQYSEDEIQKNNIFSTYYFKSDGIPYSMQYRTDGKFANEFGEGFFNEANNLVFEIL
ncbi:MAG: AAA family ATPase [bacterium]